ncbi:ATP-binding protein [Patescibacteria group bacterium]|nr:ATP-binding protein [Patescibacteria group bacterium]
MKKFVNIVYKKDKYGIIPKTLIEKESFVKVNDFYYRTFYLYDYPDKIDPFFMKYFLNQNYFFVISQYIYPIEKVKIFNSLKHRIAALSSKRHSHLSKGNVRDVSLDLEINNLEEFREVIVSGKNMGFAIGTYFLLQGKKKKDLNHSTINFQSLYNGRNFLIHELNFRQKDGFLSSIPLADDHINSNFIIDSKTLSFSNLFVSSNVLDYEGIIYGIERENNSLVIFDIFKFENYNGVIFAKSGAGKSFFAKTSIIRMLSKGINTIVIDPEGEYKNLCKNMRGKYIKITHNSKFHVNPFDKSKNETIEEKIQFIKGFLKRVCSIYNGNDLDKALLTVFNKFREPTFKDLYDILKKNRSVMANEVYNISFGSNASLYSEKTNINIRKHQLVVFDISSLDSENMSLMMYIILNYIYVELNRKEKNMVYIDEAHRLLESHDLTNYLKSITKRSRKYNLGIVYITQDVGDFISTDEGKSIIANTSFKILLKQEKINIEGLSNSFALLADEKEYLLSLNIGEGLVIAKDIHVNTQFFAFDFEKKIFK